MQLSFGPHDPHGKIFYDMIFCPKVKLHKVNSEILSEIHLHKVSESSAIGCEYPRDLKQLLIAFQWSIKIYMQK